MRCQATSVYRRDVGSQKAQYTIILTSIQTTICSKTDRTREVMQDLSSDIPQRFSPLIQNTLLAMLPGYGSCFPAISSLFEGKPITQKPENPASRKPPLALWRRFPNA